MAESIVKVPVSIGDTVYKKIRRFISCRYSNDKYAEKGEPNCNQHFYDCSPEEGGHKCDAKYKYLYEPVVVDEMLYSDFVCALVRKPIHEYDPYNNYFLNEKDAIVWMEKNNG